MGVRTLERAADRGLRGGVEGRGPGRALPPGGAAVPAVRRAWGGARRQTRRAAEVSPRRARSARAQPRRAGAVLVCAAALAPGLSACDVELPRTAGRATAPADTVAGEVAFRLAGPNEAALVVPVHVNGAGPYDFVFDTGATITCVDPDIVRRLGLEETPFAPGVGIGVGGAERVRVVRLASLRIGAARVEDVLACVLELEQVRGLGLEVHGLVGLNFMKPFRITLDFERRVLRIVRP